MTATSIKQPEDQSGRVAGFENAIKHSMKFKAEITCGHFDEENERV